MLSDERIKQLACVYMEGDVDRECERAIRLAVAETAEACRAELAAANEAMDALRAEVERLRALMARILEEPSNTMSDAKALREIIRMVKAQAAIDAARKGA